MAEAVLTTERVYGKPNDEGDTTHVTLQNEQTLRDDLKYLGEKLGVDVNALQIERVGKERQARQEEIKKRQEKKKAARAAEEARLGKEFLDGYGFKDGHFGITINGKRIHKLKSFDEIVCPQCGEPLRPQGLATSIVETGRQIMEHPLNPLSAFYFVQCRIQDVECKNKHVSKVIVQRIL